MIEAAITSILVLLLAWANGANDIPKGIATLVGSGVGNPLRAVAWGTLCTVTGGLAALAWGGGLGRSGHPFPPPPPPRRPRQRTQDRRRVAVRGDRLGRARHAPGVARL